MHKPTITDKFDIKTLDKLYVESLRYRERKSSTGSFSASSAGYCMMKNVFKFFGADPEPFSDDAMKQFRLGELIHSDIQTSLLGYHEEMVSKGLIVMSELSITVPTWNIKGRLDLLIWDPKTHEAIIIDLKSAKAFTWSKIFGTRQAPDSEGIQRPMQVCTYAKGLKDTYGIVAEQLLVGYYKKDDSHIKATTVHPSFHKITEDYWIRLNNVTKRLPPNMAITGSESMGMVTALSPQLTPGQRDVPVESWECRYCQYAKYCNSPFKEKDGKKEKDEK
jgi:hypothetical protein